MSNITADSIKNFTPSLFFSSLNCDVDRIVQDSFNQDLLPIVSTLNPYSLDRLGSTIFYRIPQLLSLGRDLSKINALELGCGRGLRAIPWSRLFRRYWGFDLDSSAITLAKEALHQIKRENLSFTTKNAIEVLRDPKSFGIDEPINCVILYAVLEHMTLAERKETLQIVSQLLSVTQGILIVAETPNRLIHHDGHSSFLHFFNSLPPELALEYLAKSPRMEAREILSATDPYEKLCRFGLGVSFHEFELYLMRKDKSFPSIIDHGWNFWTAFDEPLRGDEFILADYFRHNGRLSHPAFARFWIEAIFDFSKTIASDPNFPVLLKPEVNNCVQVFKPTECWHNHMFVSSYPNEFKFSLKDIKPMYLQLDLHYSKGSFALCDSERNVLREYRVEELRAARFPKWHNNCVLDLSHICSDEILLIKPLQPESQVVLHGILAMSK